MGKKDDLVNKIRKEYSVNDDYTGSIGHALADRILKHSELSDMENLYEKKDKIEKILNKYNPSSWKKQGVSYRIRLKSVLGKLKKAGAEIKDYSRMNESEMWNYYISLRKELKR